MPDVYRDTDERYRNDPEFYSAVRTLEAIAREHGFTPGELKQIAFKAALNIEVSTKPLLLLRRGAAVEIVDLAPGERPVPWQEEEDEGYEALHP